MQEFIREATEPVSQIYSDEAATYKEMADYVDESAGHSASEYVRDITHAKGMENLWASLKRSFHHILAKHLHRYVSEFATRHNLRPKDTEAIMTKTVARMVGKRLTYEALTAD